MRINFKKVSAIAASALMFGLTMGTAAAANYPNPFVVSGNADVAIVYGTGAGVSSLDVVQAGNIGQNLQSYMTGSTGGSSVSTSGEVVALDSSSSRIWLNTSLNAVKSTLTKTDLPTVLADYSFSGNVDSKITSTIKLQTGDAAGGEHSGKIIFAKQPTSSEDPAIGISLNTTEKGHGPLYNASATMSAINFTSADSEGEEIVLFGQKFTVSADTDTTDIVLLKESQKVDLDSTTSSTSVTIGNLTYTIALVSASDTSATIMVTDSSGNSDTREVNEADSKKINGLEVGVINADENNLKYSASIIVGTDKLTLTNGAAVTTGDSDDPIDGTYAYIVGGTGATTEIAVAVLAPDSSNDAILPGESFIDPVFGSFKVDFAGLSSPLTDPNRETISVQNAGDDTESFTITDNRGNTKSVEFAHNATTGSINYQPVNWRLADDSNNSIYVYEMANLTQDDYTILGNEDYGRLVQVSSIYNNTGTDYTKDKVTLRDVFSGENYNTVFTSECLGTGASCGTISIDGKTYSVSFNNTGDDGYAQIKYPTSDSSGVGTFVLYPTIETENGAHVALYEPLTVNLSDFNKSTNLYKSTFEFPDGDGYTAVAATYNGATGGINWTIGGTMIETQQAAEANYTTSVIGKLKYNFTSTAGVNTTNIYLTNPETGANIKEPALVVFEGKDDQSTYNVQIIDLENAPAGTSTDGVGVSDIYVSSSYYNETGISLSSNSDITERVDWFGVLSKIDAGDSDQKAASLLYPEAQVYAQLYIGASDAIINSAVTPSGSTQLGNVLVMDSEVSTVSSKNLIVVGGSCINSVAASLLGSAACGSDFTTATGIGTNQFLIQSLASTYSTSKIALVVAGYEAADTANAEKYLTTQTVDTTVGKKYKGTNAQTAELVVA